MGCCCDKQLKQNDELIQTQIKLAVREQQELEQNEQEQEVFMPKVKIAKEIILNESEDEEINKKNQKKKVVKRDDNYLRIIEYKTVKINHFILTPKTDVLSSYYEFVVNITHLDFSYDIFLKAIVISDQDWPFKIMPQTYSEAQKQSQYDCFFRYDTYFCIDYHQNSNKQSFNYLLEITRSIEKVQELVPEMFQVKGQKKEDQLASNQKNSPTKRKKPKTVTEILSEMMEIIHIFDLETCPRFQQLLYALVIQQQFPLLKANIIFIQEVYFLFDDKPSLDNYDVEKVAIFYDYLDYNLQELQEQLIKDNKQLSYMALLKLSLDLVQILYKVYNNYLYRCNFTLKSIFFVSKSQRFQLQFFSRVQSLGFFNSSEQKPNVFSQANESKLKTFYRDFEKDFGAMCDIILLFKNVKNSIQKIKKIRRKKKNQIDHYIKYEQYAQNILDFEKRDKHLFEIIKMKCQQINADSFKAIMDNFESLIPFLENQLMQEEKLYQNYQQKNQSDDSSIKIDNSMSFDNEELIYNFSYNVSRELKKENQNNEFILFQEIKYTSIFGFDNFQSFYDEFISITNDEILKAYCLVLQANMQSLKIQIREEKQRIQQQFLQEASKILMRLKTHLHQDSFNYYILYQIVNKLKEKPIQLLNQLREIQNEQNLKRKKQIKPRLSSQHQYNGIIELRKRLILDQLFIQYFVQRNQYNQALTLMQFDITLQLKNNQKENLLYAKTLFFNGLLCQQSMQDLSAMLNLEVCQLIFQKFFPTSKYVNIDQDTQQIVQEQDIKINQKIKRQIIFFENEASENLNILDFNLGIVYSHLSDKDNSLKSLKKVKKIREKKYDLLSDEVIEVVLQILRLHVDQEETGPCMDICIEYKKKFRQQESQKIIYKSRWIAKLQLVMAAVFECQGMLISSFQYYQKAHKTFQWAHSNSLIRSLYIFERIKYIIHLIKEKAFETCSLITKQENVDISQYIGRLSEIVKPCLTNQFIRNIDSSNFRFADAQLTKQFIRANQRLYNHDYVKALKLYQLIHEKFKKQKIDLCYGLTLEKIGILYLIQKNVKTSIKHLHLASELHARFLQFPIKEIHIFNCQLYILIGNALLKERNQCAKQIDHIDTIIDDINDQLKWQMIPYQYISNKFAILCHKLGRSVLYQLEELYENIENYLQLRKKIGQNLTKENELKAIALQFIQEKFSKQIIGFNSIDEKRKTCLFGLNSAVSVSKREGVHSLSKLLLNSNVSIQLQSIQNQAQLVTSEENETSVRKTTQQSIQPKIINEQKSNIKSPPPTALGSPIQSPIVITKKSSIKTKKEQKLNPFDRVSKK